MLFWVIMELNLLSFSLVLLVDKTFSSKQDRLNYLVFYFLIQSRASILFLSNFCFRDWGSIFNVDNIFLLSLVLKIGLFPLFFWVFRIREALRFLGLFLLLTFQKVPLLIGLFCCDSPILFYVLLLSLISGSLILFFSPRFISIILRSSISYRFIIFLLFIYSFKFFIFFFLTYRFFVFIALNFFFEKDFLSDRVLFLVFSFFMGLPPLSLFFFKYLFRFEIVSLFGYSELLLFWACRLLRLVGYLKFFYYSFYERSYLYFKGSPLSKTGYLIYFILLSLISFLC